MESTGRDGSTGNGDRRPDRLLVAPLVDAVAFPHVVVPLVVEDAAVAEALREVQRTHKQIALVAVRPDRTPAESDPLDPPFYAVGTRGSIVQMVRLPDGTVRMLVQGEERVRAREFLREVGTWYVRAEPVPDTDTAGLEVEALHRVVVGQFSEIAAASPQLPDEVLELIARIDEPARFVDQVAGHLNLALERKQALLEERSVVRRLETLATVLGQEKQVLEYGSRIQQRIKGELERTQREVLLREQLKAIRQELGESDEDDAENLRRQLETRALPEPARAQADRELRRMERTPPQSPEYHMIRSYLEWLLELPWSRESEETIDLARARGILERDHYDLDEVKARILEFLAVRKLNPESQGPILCFVGPPGVGKTSLGRSIAEALGRDFARISLGGVRDEAEIRGHRRTYVGSLPGRIVQAIRRAGTRNPVFMLDEIDKVGHDFRGDPTSALLEVLDPAQNHSFSDHYLEVPFDLSRVLFVGTANTLSTVPPALRDRLEVLTLPGYTERDKCQIARRHLIPQQLAAAGLDGGSVRISDGAVQRLITEYTREAGVRELERRIAGVFRKVALRAVEQVASGPVRITRRNLAGYAGKRRYERELAGRRDEVGAATALAYTPEGGQILFVEAVRMPGKERVSLTGHMGGVMKESARAALSYLRAHAGALGVDDRSFYDMAVHVHIPAGATPKDGPSAGVALVVSLGSLFTGRAVRREVAMTGEITLRGHVLPVGGIKEKLIAAADAGIRTVLLPRRNEADLEDVPPDVRGKLDLVFIDEVAEALEHALGSPVRVAGTGPGRPPRLAAS